MATSLKAQANGAIFDGQQFDIAPMRMEIGSNLFQRLPHARLKGWGLRSLNA